jgi:proteic killer suppression protein
MRYTAVLIRSFGDARTERLFHDQIVRAFEGFAARAKRKLEAVNAAARLDDLRVPPSNRLEKLRGRLDGFHSVRINDQWRVVFKWADNSAYEVSIMDYH